MACGARRRTQRTRPDKLPHGGCTWMTRSTPWMSRPRAATSVATRHRRAPFRNASSVVSRSFCGTSPWMACRHSDTSGQAFRRVVIACPHVRSFVCLRHHAVANAHLCRDFQVRGHRQFRGLALGVGEDNGATVCATVQLHDVADRLVTGMERALSNAHQSSRQSHTRHIHTDSQAGLHTRGRVKGVPGACSAPRPCSPVRTCSQ